MFERQIARLILVFPVIGIAAASTLADVSDLLGRIPPGANAIVVIDVDGVVTSPLGLRNNWKEKLADAYAAKPLIVPPNARKVVMASWIEPTSMLPIWEASVMELSGAPSMERIAKSERGFVDTLAGKQAAWSPINAYFLRLDGRLLGALCPADRQFAARWAGQDEATGKLVSAYLRSADRKSVV